MFHSALGIRVPIRYWPYVSNSALGIRVLIQYWPYVSHSALAIRVLIHYWPYVSHSALGIRALLYIPNPRGKRMANTISQDEERRRTTAKFTIINPFTVLMSLKSDQ